LEKSIPHTKTEKLKDVDILAGEIAAFG